MECRGDWYACMIYMNIDGRKQGLTGPSGSIKMIAGACDPEKRVDFSFENHFRFASAFIWGCGK
jgi:hypothetical protein